MPPQDVQRIGWKIHKLTFLMDRLADQALKTGKGLTFAEFRLLMALRHRGPLPQNVIAKFHGVTEAAISKKISPLVSQGLIVRRLDPDNRRVRLLAITKKGEQRAIQASRIVSQKFTPLFRVLPKPAQRRFEQNLDMLLASIWAKGKKVIFGSARKFR